MWSKCIKLNRFLMNLRYHSYLLIMSLNWFILFSFCIFFNICRFFIKNRIHRSLTLTRLWLIMWLLWSLIIINFMAFIFSFSFILLLFIILILGFFVLKFSLKLFINSYYCIMPFFIIIRHWSCILWSRLYFFLISISFMYILT